MSWDASYTDATATRFRAHLAVVDTTSKTSPSLVASSVTNDSAGEQSWSSTPGGGNGSTNVGWFMYYNENDPCASEFDVTVSTDLFRSFTGLSSAVVSSGFPVLISDRAKGMSDHIGAVRNGTSNNHPFGTWAEPETTDVNGGCIACESSQYSLRIRGVEVTP